MNFMTHKRAALEKRQVELSQEWDGLNSQIGRTMNESDKLRLQRQADMLEAEIVALEAQIAAIPVDSPAVPPPIALNQFFICYAPRDGLSHAQRLHAALRQAGLPAWLDSADTPAGHDPDEARESALRECAAMLLILTPGSADANSESATEWRRALRFKKPLIPLRFAAAEPPLALGRRSPLPFDGDWETALALLRRHLENLSSPEGQLRELEYRRADAERELRYAPPEQRPRLQQDIDQLEAAITRQRTIVRDPQAAARQTEQRIASGLERERQPERPTGRRAATRFINPPPLTAPSYFQDRHVENELIADFLRNPARRLLTVVGRGGVGKTALVCRLLKALESGRLPDDLGDLPVRGIVYLSAVGARPINFANLFADLLKLLPADERPALEAVYKDPQSSVVEKLRPVWTAFRNTAARPDPHPVILLLDNLEDLLDPASHAFREAEVAEALVALLDAPPHPVKALLTSRLLPTGLPTHRPERQMTLPLDDGLPSPFAEAVLRAGDPTGALRLRDATDADLAPACAYTRGYPRALEAITAALTADRAATLAELLAGPPPENVVMALVGEAYSRLDKAAQQTLQALAVFGRPVPAAAVDYLLQPTLHDVDSAPILNRLVNSRFVAKEAGRYYLHPVDREYAFARIPQGDDQRPTAEDRPSTADHPTNDPLAELERLLRQASDTPSPPHPLTPSSKPPFTQTTLLARAADYYRQARKPRAAWKTLDDLGPQLAEFDLRCAAGMVDAAASVLTDIDFDYLLLWGHVRLMARLHERLQGKIGDRRLAANSASNLGNAYSHLGRISEAIDYYEQALAIARDIGNRHGEGNNLGNLGNAYSDLGRIPEAIDYYEQALAIARDIGNRHGEGNNLGNLGNAYSDLGRISEAIDYYEQALAIARDIADRRGEGNNLGNLGNAYSDLGRISEAIDYYEQALAIARDIADRRGEGMNLGNLGSAYYSLGRIPEAITYYEQALAIARDIADRRGEGSRLGNLGICYWELERVPEAVAHLEQALTIARAIGDRRGEGNRLGNLSEAFWAQGDFSSALAHAQESVRIAEELAAPDLINYHATNIALIQASGGDFAAALAVAETACAHACPTNNAAAQAARGVVLLRLGRPAAAQAAFQAAITAAEALPGYEALHKQLDNLGVARCGLALVEPAQREAHLAAARAAFRAARTITTAPGIVAHVRRQLALLDAGLEGLADGAGQS